MVDQFKEYLLSNGRSENTANSYRRHVNGYVKWFESTKQLQFKKLYEENVREYVQHLRNIKQKPSTINAKINALNSFNMFLVECGIQSTTFNTKGVLLKVQQQYASLAKVTQEDVERFRQMVLESGNVRNYTLITLLAYAGLRISEALDLMLEDVCIRTREMTVTGKGDKTRVVLMNSKVRVALEKYLEIRDSDSPYLFYSRQSDKLNRTTVNKIFKQFTHPHPILPENSRGFLHSKNFQNLRNPMYPYRCPSHHTIYATSTVPMPSQSVWTSTK